MAYTPSYSETKLNILKRYVENFKKSLMKKVASVFTESYRSQVSKAPTDGDQRYIYFNNLLFEGLLPKGVKVYLTDSKQNKSRSTGFSSVIRRKNYIAMYNDAKNPEDRTLGAWWPSSNSIYIFLDKVGYDDFAIDTVLVHEMCHVYQDRVFSGKVSGFDHGNDFQIPKRKVEKESKGIYNGGAFINIDGKIKDYRNGRYGDPSLGRTEKQTANYYKKRINSELKEIQKNLKIENVNTREFKYNKHSFVFTGKHFRFVSTNPTQDEKLEMKILNKNEELLDFLIDSFEQIKKKRGI